MNMYDFTGNTSSYNASVCDGAAFWWGNNLNNNQPELWPGMGSIYNNSRFSYEQTWSGFAASIGPGVGASFAPGVTNYINWLNRAFNIKTPTK